MYTIHNVKNDTYIIVTNFVRIPIIKEKTRNQQTNSSEYKCMIQQSNSRMNEKNKYHYKFMRKISTSINLCQVQTKRCIHKCYMHIMPFKAFEYILLYPAKFFPKSRT